MPNGGIVYIEEQVAPQIIDKDVLGSYARGGGIQLYFLEEDLEKIQIIDIFDNNIK